MQLNHAHTSKAALDSSVEENNPHHNQGSQLLQFKPQDLCTNNLYNRDLRTPEHHNLVELKENVAYVKIIMGLQGLTDVNPYLSRTSVKDLSGTVMAKLMVMVVNGRTCNKCS